MTEHLNYIKTLAEHLQETDDEITKKGLVIILISSLPEEYNIQTITFETIADDHLT